MPDPNDGWDDEVDDWEAYPVRKVQVQPADYVPKDWGKKSGAERHQFGSALLVALLGLGGALMY